MLRPSITCAKWQDSSTRSKVPFTRSKLNGKEWWLMSNHTRKHGKSKELMLFLQFFRNIWEFYLLKKQVFSTITSKTILSAGKTICKRFQKRFRCSHKCKDSGSIWKPFLPHNKIKIDSLSETSTSSRYSIKESAPIWTEFILNLTFWEHF